MKEPKTPQQFFETAKQMYEDAINKTDKFMALSSNKKRAYFTQIENYLDKSGRNLDNLGTDSASFSTLRAQSIAQKIIIEKKAKSFNQ